MFYICGVFSSKAAWYLLLAQQAPHVPYMLACACCCLFTNDEWCNTT